MMTLALAFVVLMAGVVFTSTVDESYAEDESVASVDGVGFSTLGAAIEVADNGDTIILLSDVEQADGITIDGKELTIDLNDKTFKVTEGASTNNRNFKIIGESIVTIKNGTIIAAGDYSSGAYGTIRTEGNAKVTLEDLELFNYRGYGLNIKAVGGTVDIKDTKIYSQYGGGVEAAGGTVTLTDVTIEQKGMYQYPYISVTVAVSEGGNVTINSGKYSTIPLGATDANNEGANRGSWCLGVYNTGGTLTVNGGEFSNGYVGETDPTNPREVITIGAIGGSTAELIINGGTFTSIGAFAFCEETSADGTAYTDGEEIISINGGQFVYKNGFQTGDSALESFTIEAGTFSDDEVAEFVKDGSIVEVAGVEYIKSGSELIETANLITISNSEELIEFSNEVGGGDDYDGEYVILGADIDMQGIEFSPIGNVESPFKGTFDGRGHYINNLTITGTEYVALFGFTNSATIKNVNLSNADIEGNHFVGGIVAYSVRSTITGCTVSDSVIGATPMKVSETYDHGNHVGGIVAYLQNNNGNWQDKTIVQNNAVYDTKITAYRDVGGIVGTDSHTENTGYNNVVADNKVSGIEIIVDQKTCFYEDKPANAGEIRGRSTADIPLDESNVYENVTISITLKDPQVVGEGKSLTIDGTNVPTEVELKTGSSVVIATGGDLSVSMVVLNGDDKIVLKGVKGTLKITQGSTDIEGTLEEGDLEIWGDSALTNDFIILAGANVLFKEGSVLDLAGNMIGVQGTTEDDVAADLTIEGQVKDTIGYGSIVISGNLYLDGADVRVPVIEMGDDAYISISNPKKMTVSGNQTADLGVGYGNTLVLKDLDVPAGKSIDAWGTVVIEGTVTVQDQKGFNVYQGGYAQIDGALVIEGAATVNGKADINGSVKVYNADGGASFTAGGEVNVLGTMDVLKGKTKEAADNTLTVNGDLNVEGTLTITGKLAGNVNDMGTVVFNGTAGTSAKITVFDGVTFAVTAVDGKLTITDAGITDEDYTKENGYYVSTGNSVEIQDVKNVTVSVVLDETSAKDANKDSVRLVRSVMTVSGTVTAIDDEIGTVTIDGAGISNAYVTDKYVQGGVAVSDVTLGKKVTLNLGVAAVVAVADVVVDDIDVLGTVTAVAENSAVVTNAVVDVFGTIVIGEESAVDDETILNVNGAMYVIDDVTKDDDRTVYYTTLENALAAVATAQDNEIEVLGTVKIDSELTVPAEAKVLVKGTMEIGVDGKVIVEATGLFDASASTTVNIDGMLVIMDKESGLEGESALTYQVFTETETSATYSGLVLALKNAVAGDVIVVNGNEAKIEKSVTIPEGVTLEVPKTKTLTVGSADEDVTLTVAGTLVVAGKVDRAVTNEDVEIAVPGVIMKTGTMALDNESTPAVVEGFVMDDYVEFAIKVDGRPTTVYSNLTYAAENADDLDVKVYGDVTAGDITFTMGEKSSEMSIEFGKSVSSISVSSMTLVSNGKGVIALDAKTIAGEVTGTIASAAGSVDLVKASGITVTVSIITDVDGSTDLMTVDGTLVGKMTVATGTVNAGAALATGATEENILTVATGATLLVSEGKLTVLTTATGVDEYYGLIVDGTLAVDNGTVTISGEALVNGTMTVADVTANSVIIGDKLVVLGTLSVVSTEDAPAVVNNNGVIVIGTAPAIGANGTVSGPIDNKNSDNAYIVAYAGADVSAAVIDPSADGTESTAKSTEIIINGTPYMTVYVDPSNSDVTLNTLKDAGFFDIEGYTQDIVWEKPVLGTTPVGSVESVEGTKVLDKVDKVTVSAGVGLKVFVDGLEAKSDMDLQFGTHTVTFEVLKGYDGSNATITVNGVAVANGGTFTIDVDDKEVVIIASGAVPAQSGSTVVVGEDDDGMKLTDILLIVLVVLIVIMAIIVALRMMRS